MSDTRKTDPGWTRFFNDPNNCHAVHNHENGPCDLPDLGSWARLVRANHGNTVGLRRCRWDYDWNKLPCGCRMCTEHHQRRTDRRRARRQARRQLRHGVGRWEDQR